MMGVEAVVMPLVDMLLNTLTFGLGRLGQLVFLSSLFVGRAVWGRGDVVGMNVYAFGRVYLNDSRDLYSRLEGR